MERNTDVLVGLQYGSEAKGLIAAHISNNYDAHVRVGSIQSGHTTYVIHEGIPHRVVMRSIPSGWVNLDAWLIIGPGAFISPEILMDEIAKIEPFDPAIRSRLVIDERTWCVWAGDRHAEKGMSDRMGSTGEGSGASLIRKIKRGADNTKTLAKDHELLRGLQFGDTTDLLETRHRVLLEGSQGTLLGMHTSGYWPYCTSRECTAQAWMAEAGIPPSRIRDVIGVARTFPIRVGGNSGPAAGRELDWQELSEIAGGHITPEKTTVTQRVRRIFEWNNAEMRHSIRINGPSKMAVNFANYLDMRNQGAQKEQDLTMATGAWFARKELDLGVEIKWTTTDPKTVVDFA